MDARLSLPDTTIAPGLLQVFRLAAAIRLAFLVVVAVILAGLQLPGLGLALLVLGDALLFLAALGWTPLQTGLGRRFLPLMLAWALLSTLAVRLLLLAGVTGMTAPPALLPWAGATLPDEVDLLVNAGFNLAWMAVPVVLATWQYGARGLQWSMAAVTLGSLAPILVLPAGAMVRLAAGVDLAGRLAIIGLVAIVVERLVRAQQQEQRALELANRQLAVRAATVEQLAESRERNRLAREMHDTLAHSLTGLSVQLQALGRVLESDPVAAQVQLKAAQATVRDGVAEARRSIQALRATPLADLGLAEALRQLCRSYAERLGIVFTCGVEEVGVLEPAVEQALYRTAEGALANVERHANATYVSMSLAQQGAIVCLRIADDGAGFDPAAVPPERYGLAGMHERAQAIGATLTVQSMPGRGTVVVMEVHL